MHRRTGKPSLQASAKKSQHCSREFCLQKESGKADTGARKNDNLLLTIEPDQLITDSQCIGKQASQPAKRSTNCSVCGKTPAYPQQQMCRSRFFAGQSVFVQDRFSLDTMFFQPIRQHVNP
jgi:hypothetical protein